MTRYTPEQRWDHRRDERKHEWRPGDPITGAMTEDQIVAELGRIEREMRDAAAKGQCACKEAMTIIEALMNDIGIPFAKGDA
jgi:hypothetical protein